VVFLGFFVYFMMQGAEVNPNFLIFTLPFILLQMAVMGLGFGILISSLMTKNVMKISIILIAIFMLKWKVINAH